MVPEEGIQLTVQLASAAPDVVKGAQASQGAPGFQGSRTPAAHPRGLLLLLLLLPAGLGHCFLVTNPQHTNSQSIISNIRQLNR